MRVHLINRPLIVGEEVLVPHVLDIPLMWPPHTDVHDGQMEFHYHSDERFQTLPKLTRLRHLHFKDVKWLPAIVIRSQFTGFTRTPLDYIVKGIKNIKCNALVKGKCPHKGFNMDQITLNEHLFKVCPMHGMRFNIYGKGVPYYKDQIENDPPDEDHKMYL